MKQKILIFLSVLFLVGLAIFLYPGGSTPEEREPAVSWKEHFGQLFLIGFEGEEVTSELASLMAEIRPAGVLLLQRNIENKEQVKKLVEDLQELSLRNTGFRLFVAVDQEGGPVSRIPFAEDTNQSQLQDFSQAFFVGSKRGEDLKAIGVNMNLAPVLDSNNKLDFVFERTFQTTKNASMKLAEGLVQGHQLQGIVSVPKHFPGYDGVAFNPEEDVIPIVPSLPSIAIFENLFQELAIPFVLLSHVQYQDFDQENVFPFSSKGIQLVKEKLGENVLVMSDDILSRAFLKAFTYEEIGRSALEAGVNIMITAGYPDAKAVGEFYRAFFEMIEGDEELQKRTVGASQKIIELKRDVVHNAFILK
ncbi:MAG: glycoside hydrolase family 3 N-terminal domain-containing protein [Candidatus Wildermuthbacteria bacterium]|nr:glycoside hydrolase family 3 N-terminal domain-containing protein [Candidatus Wildermuthbacteria bacterium]